MSPCKKSAVMLCCRCIAECVVPWKMVIKIISSKARKTLTLKHVFFPLKLSWITLLIGSQHLNTSGVRSVTPVGVVSVCLLITDLLLCVCFPQLISISHGSRPHITASSPRMMTRCCWTLPWSPWTRTPRCAMQVRVVFRILVWFHVVIIIDIYTYVYVSMVVITTMCKPPSLLPVRGEGVCLWPLWSTHTGTVMSDCDLPINSNYLKRTPPSLSHTHPPNHPRFQLRLVL